MKYKVYAKTVSYPHIVVEADNEEDAIGIAENADGGDFILDNEQSDEWQIAPSERKVREIKQPWVSGEIITDELVSAMESIISYMEDEKESYELNPSGGHIYMDVVTLMRYAQAYNLNKES